MEPLFLVGGAAVLLLLLRGGGSSEPEALPLTQGKPSIPSPSSPPNGVYADAGMTLARAQQILVALKYDLGNTGADGKYGPKTRAALTSYQTKSSLSAHGFLDRATANSLSATPSASTAAAAVSSSPAASASAQKALGYSHGYNVGAESNGLAGDSKMLAVCASAGSASGGACDANFVTGYKQGFEQGTFDAGFSDGYDGLAEPAPSASYTYRRGYAAGAAAASEKDVIGSDPADWASTEKPEKTVIGDTIFWDEGGGSVSGSRSMVRTARVAGVDIMMVSRERPERMRAERAERMK